MRLVISAAGDPAYPARARQPVRLRVEDVVADFRLSDSRSSPGAPTRLTLVEYRPLEIYTALVAEYLALILVASWLVRQLEYRLGSNQADKR